MDDRTNAGGEIFSQNRFAISIKPSPSYIDLSLDTHTSLSSLDTLDSFSNPAASSTAFLLPSSLSLSIYFSLPQYRPERLIPFSTRCSVRTETAVKGGEVNRWEAEIDARSQTRVTQGEGRRSARPTDNPSPLFPPFIIRYRSFPFSFVSFRFVSRWGSRDGRKESKRMERARRGGCQGGC